MDSKKVEELLAKYWNCETSVEEEVTLREYFSRGDADGSLKETSAMFTYFSQQRRREVHDAAWNERILGLARPKQAGIDRFVRNSLRIAAGIVVLMVAVWFVRSEIRQGTPQELVDTYSDPELAFEETKKALLMISKGFGTAEEQAKKINIFNEAQRQIQNDRPSVQEQ